MNWLSLRALWRGIRGKSLTFSMVYAMAVMGLSFAGVLRESFRTIGLWGPLIWIGPIVLTGLMAKHEYRLKISDGFRRICAYGLIVASSLLAYGLIRYEASMEERYPQLKWEPPQEQVPAARKFGPRGK